MDSTIKCNSLWATWYYKITTLLQSVYVVLDLSLLFKPRLCSTVLGIKHAHTRQRSGPLLWKSWFSKDLPPSPEIQYYFPGEDRYVTTKYGKYYKVAVCRLYAFVFLEQTEIQSNTYFVVKQLVCSIMFLRNYCIL